MLRMLFLQPDATDFELTGKAMTPEKRKAILVEEPGGPEALKIQERSVPQAGPGQVLIKVRAFGLNRAELFTRRGDSGKAVPFPRVIGMECVGQVVSDPDGQFSPGPLPV